MQTKQYLLDLPVDAGLTKADFALSESSRGAFEAVTRWPEWQENALLLSGPAASGKTHLAHIWAVESHAIFLRHNDVQTGAAVMQMMEAPARTAYVLENIHTLGADTALFHLLNTARERKQYLLLTANTPAAGLVVALPDLGSRLLAMPSAALNAPDDVLLRMVMVKLFSDRQLKVTEDVVDYILLRMERSFAAAQLWAQKIDARSLETQKRITVALARDVMQSSDKQQDLM